MTGPTAAWVHPQHKPRPERRSGPMHPRPQRPRQKRTEISRYRLPSLVAQAQLSFTRSRYGEAARRYRRALAIAEKALAPDVLELAVPLNGLAVVYKYQARFAEARRLYRRALAILEKALGPDHPEVATLYHNLGGLEHARGRYARGEPWPRGWVPIREKVLGPDPPDVAADVAARGALLGGKG